MRAFLIFITVIIISNTCYSQSLDGEWKGSMTDSYLPGTSYMKLFFLRNTDSSYKIFSYCKGQNSKGIDTIIVAKVNYKRKDSESIYLEEVEVLKPKKVINNCLFKMDLKITAASNDITLHGKWYSEECRMDGTITFKKSKK